MYTPEYFVPEAETVHELLAGHGAADLVTVTPHGMLATLLPFVYERETGEQGALLGHLARANGQWRAETAHEALVIVRGPDAYISPTWYPSTARHHREVPTWNYITAHVYGNLIVHDDPDWVRRQIRGLVDRHEAGQDTPWSVDDAPADFVDRLLRGTIGVELAITRIEATFKLNQNHSGENIDGVVAGLMSRRHGQDVAVAEAVAAHSPHGPQGSGPAVS
ncbi:FMN-binding negative transcriptional regulator [Streptomyces sp. LP05-1]|uniref:FMN-binding negative transcriptional regulator n=1 Tax=Streptomyces pyxinae TaxID=2970734 RepID=A0ABT2CJM7_9ACTN|nr:FMN-binding negative transcriptional regulator [Streptomyces sp. LP05-1]MCS0636916.1 FMN-binding negative transcriptional regulator [Streptomyces sp. LP05-1]